MWEPRIAVDTWAWFAVAYLFVTVVVVAGLIALLVRFRVPPRLFKWWAAAGFALSIGLFLWLAGSSVVSAVLLGTGIVPVVLIAAGGLGHVPPEQDS